MSKWDEFGEFIRDILTKGGFKIFGRFQKTFAEYKEEFSRSEEERKRLQRLLNVVSPPKIKRRRTDVQHLSLPEPPQIKEEQELWTSQEEEQLQGLKSETTDSIFTRDSNLHIKTFLSERLTAAASEIFETFEIAFTEYQEKISRSEEERKRLQRLLDVVTQPEITLHRTDVQHLSLLKPTQIKEEQELWTNQEEEQLQASQSETTDSIFTSPSVKNNSDQEGFSVCSHLDQTVKMDIREGDSLSTNTTEEQIKAEPHVQDYAVPEPGSDSQPLSVEHQSFLETLESKRTHINEPVSWDSLFQQCSERFSHNSNHTSVTMSQSVPSKQHKGLDFLQNINEMDSEGEQCVDGEDDGDECCVVSDSGSETDSEVERAGESWWRDTARDGTVWVEQTASCSRGRGREGGAIKEAPGPTSFAKDKIKSPLSSFLCLIDTEMWQKIRLYTEAEAERKSEKFKVSDEELKAFVGLVYLRGIMGGTSVKVDDYWSADLGNSIFKDTMSRQKFRDIMRYLRFDDKNTRSERLLTDRFAMMSEIFDKFVKNSIASYTPGENITIDEQLLPTKAQCRFTQYMAKKQDKFGIKFWVAADTSTKYMLNALPYLGRGDSGADGPRFSDSVLMHLVEPFLGKGRNVTTHNFFPSLALANSLFAYKTTVVGTAKKSVKGMPRCAQAQGERFSTKVLKAGKVSLTVYQAKAKANMCILSTMHQTVLTDDSAKKLPDTVSYYKSTKAGVNALDQMARQYSVRGGSHRWPVAVFYNILDLAAVNAHILYTQSMNVRISRRKFILRLVKELCAPQKSSKVEEARKRLLPESTFQPLKRRRCQVNRCSGNKTFDICQACKRLVCGKCSKNSPKLCLEC